MHDSQHSPALQSIIRQLLLSGWLYWEPTEHAGIDRSCRKGDFLIAAWAWQEKRMAKRTRTREVSTRFVSFSDHVTRKLDRQAISRQTHRLFPYRTRCKLLAHNTYWWHESGRMSRRKYVEPVLDWESHNLVSTIENKSFFSFSQLFSCSSNLPCVNRVAGEASWKMGALLEVMESCSAAFESDIVFASLCREISRRFFVWNIIGRWAQTNTYVIFCWRVY
jgi:hypothetical protein